MGEASGRSIKILSTRSPLFPNSLESASVANFRVLKEIISFHPVRAHKAVTVQLKEALKLYQANCQHRKVPRKHKYVYILEKTKRETKQHAF